MDFQNLIQMRYSCRSFEDKPVEQEKLDAILEAGRLAPTGGNQQPQRILVVRDKEALAKMEECTTCSFGAPVVLVCCYDTEHTAHNRIGSGRSCGHEDIAIVATHMMLACYDLGLANTWVGLLREDKLRECYQIPEEYEIIGLMPLGYAAEGAKPGPLHEKRRPLEETVFYNSF